MSEATELVRPPTMDSTKEAAKQLDTTEHHMIMMRRRGEGPPWCKVGGKYRYPNLSEWISENTVHPE